jgi:hypothetical protein
MDHFEFRKPLKLLPSFEDCDQVELVDLAADEVTGDEGGNQDDQNGEAVGLAGHHQGPAIKFRVVGQAHERSQTVAHGKAEGDGTEGQYSACSPSKMKAKSLGG